MGFHIRFSLLWPTPLSSDRRRFGLLKCALLNGPMPHHAGSVPEQAGHRAPTILADRHHQSLLCPAPLRLGVLDELEAFLRERDDADALVGAGATADQAVPLQRSKRAGNAGSVHDHVTTKGGDRNLLFRADQA